MPTITEPADDEQRVTGGSGTARKSKGFHASPAGNIGRWTGPGTSATNTSSESRPHAIRSEGPESSALGSHLFYPLTTCLLSRIRDHSN